jgi:nucleoid-associated protein YgaU
MPNDARLGLVVGVAVVIAIAVLFYRKEVPAQPPEAPAATSALPALPSPDAFRRHTVCSGETLAQLASRYYGDAGRTDLIRQANGGLKQEPPAGTVLVIPETRTAPEAPRKF